MAKIIMGRGNKVVPDLQVLVDMVAIKRPLFEFEAQMFRDEIYDDGTKTTWVRGVDVYQDAEFIGNICIARGEGRLNADGERPDAFFIESKHIQNQRGRRNTKVTSNIETAVKAVIKYFNFLKPRDICYQLFDEANDKMRGIGYRVGSYLNDMVSLDTRKVKMYFLEKAMFGEATLDPNAVTVQKDSKGKYDTYLAFKQMETKFDSMNGVREGYIVEIMRDESYRVMHTNYKKIPAEDDSTLFTRYRKFEDLPVDMQNKIAVLKIAQAEDPILDIGVKLGNDDRLMYIL